MHALLRTAGPRPTPPTRHTHTQVSWRGSDLSGTTAREATFRNVDLSGATILSGDFPKAAFTSCELNRADLSGSKLQV